MRVCVPYKAVVLVWELKAFGMDSNLVSHSEIAVEFYVLLSVFVWAMMNYFLICQSNEKFVITFSIVN